MPVKFPPGGAGACTGKGEGKSSLPKVIDGDLLPDGGQILKGSGIRTARLSQGVPAKFDGTVFDVVSSGLGEVVELLFEFNGTVLLVSLHRAFLNNVVERLIAGRLLCWEKLEMIREGWT